MSTRIDISEVSQRKTLSHCHLPECCECWRGVQIMWGVFVLFFMQIPQFKVTFQGLVALKWWNTVKKKEKGHRKCQKNVHELLIRTKKKMTQANSWLHVFLCMFIVIFELITSPCTHCTKSLSSSLRI